MYRIQHNVTIIRKIVHEPMLRLDVMKYSILLCYTDMLEMASFSGRGGVVWFHSDELNERSSIFPFLSSQNNYYNNPNPVFKPPVNIFHDIIISIIITFLLLFTSHTFVYWTSP